MTWASIDETYLGDWKNDLPHGEGEHIWGKYYLLKFCLISFTYFYFILLYFIRFFILFLSLQSIFSFLFHLLLFYYLFSRSSPHRSSTPTHRIRERWTNIIILYCCCHYVIIILLVLLSHYNYRYYHYYSYNYDCNYHSLIDSIISISSISFNY